MSVGAAEQLDLLRAVAEHKSRYFPSRWARYDEALLGQLHIVPHDRLADELRSDYAQMREMFFDEPEPFATMLNALRALEAHVNATMSESGSS